MKKTGQGKEFRAGISTTNNLINIALELHLTSPQCVLLCQTLNHLQLLTLNNLCLEVEAIQDTTLQPTYQSKEGTVLQIISVIKMVQSNILLLIIMFHPMADFQTLKIFLLTLEFLMDNNLTSLQLMQSKTLHQCPILKLKPKSVIDLEIHKGQTFLQFQRVIKLKQHMEP